MKEISGYVFKNENLLKVALTHSSFSKENYERLEFLGDSILDFIVSDYFFKNTDEKEGQLTKTRSKFVSEDFLNDVFDKLNIKNQVVLGKSYKGELSKAIKADIVEAIIAALYLDCNDLETVKNFVKSLFNFGNYKLMVDKDFKSQLQVYVQSMNKKVKYKMISKSGQSHNPLFEMAVYLDNEMLGNGISNSKNNAEQEAAHNALIKLGQI